jgi:hypothetical protein
MWDTKRILTELADTPRRHDIAAAFWRYAEPQARMLTTAQLATMLHFREETIRKMTADKKADLLAGRAASRELEQAFETALMIYHTKNKAELLAAFLDEWQIPHVNGSIEVDEYPTPTTDQVRAAVEKQREKFAPRDIAVYFATAGLLMGTEWADALWPVVDELAPSLTAA